MTRDRARHTHASLRGSSGRRQADRALVRGRGVSDATRCRPLILRSAPISPTCPTACASCARQAGSRLGKRSSSPRSYARWWTLQAGTTQSGSPQPPSERGIRCAASMRRSVPHTMHRRSATAARWRSVAAIGGVRRSGVVLRSGFLARSGARRRSDVRFIVTPFRWYVRRARACGLLVARFHA